MIKSARQLFDTIGEKFASQFPRLLLRGDQHSGHAPSQYGSVEQQGDRYLSIKTATAEAKGIPAGVGAFGVTGGAALSASVIFTGMSPMSALFPLLIAIALFVLIFIWELYRPFPLPIIFNRRTQEIYYDLNGKLYHIPWEGIEAVAYEYRNVNQYAGSMTHANLDLILQRFADPEDRIVLNIGGHTSGKHVATLAALWEYLRAYMNEGPWFDEEGQHTPHKTPFIREQLNKSGFTMRDNLKNARQRLTEAKREENGLVGAARGVLLSAYVFHPMSVMENVTYRICRDRSDKQWPEVVRERLDPNGPTTRLIDIEGELAARLKAEKDARIKAQNAALHPNQTND
jgi:hypothetical protein